jgi:hypothetical protein
VSEIRDEVTACMKSRRIQKICIVLVYGKSMGSDETAPGRRYNHKVAGELGTESEERGVNIGDPQ